MANAQTDPHLITIAIAFVLGLLSSLGYARIGSFVNQSSLAHTYATRLTRSYLGASNPHRQDLPASDLSGRATNAVEGDDLHLRPAAATTDSGYAPHTRGGPLHLINITVNETIIGRTGIQQLDRKGLPLAIGPAGISVGVRHHARWDHAQELTTTQHDAYHLEPIRRPEGTWNVFAGKKGQVVPIQAEAMTLGQLVGISGAAFSTGVGSRTSVALSLLCGLFNVRTGHWWRSGKRPRRKAPIVQGLLCCEWLARFHGTARNHWYLSDGGHFENLACYELIRRRVPFIICCDNGEDPTGEFEDLGGLVRKARLDFGADLAFLTAEELEQAIDPAFQGLIGPLENLRSTPAKDGQPMCSPTACAALGRLRYADGSTGTLLLIKPGLIGGEPEDVRYYQRSHPAFPHEPTLDQFFDEAQWESYRRLGEHLADQLFGQTAKPSLWNPVTFTPLER